MREAKLRQDLNSQVKLQKADDINITQVLAAPKYMQGDSGGAHITHQSAFPSLPHPSRALSATSVCQTYAWGPFIGYLLNMKSG